MSLILLLLIPAAASGLISLTRKRFAAELIHVFSSIATLVAGIEVIGQVWLRQSALSWNLLRADSLSAFMIGIVTFIGAVAGIYAVGYMRAEEEDDSPPHGGVPRSPGVVSSSKLRGAGLTTGSAHSEQPPLHCELCEEGYVSHTFTRVRLFYVLFQLFIFTMLLAVTTDNLGVMWVAIEGTTLATVFLVNLHDNHTGLEAAYKYLILSSVGIALAFMGTVLMYYAAFSHASEIGLSWTGLVAVATQLDPSIVKLALIFILIGYGTKAGLAPMHTWLPDTHSEAPAPISALMSGVLLNVGLYALMRFKTVADVAAGPLFASTWLTRFGLLSLGLSAAFLVSQRDYKRMLAYSSIEHTGIVALGLGFGGYWGTIGALLHMVNHALSKSMLFILSGSILLKYKTTEIRAVRGLLKAAPWTGFAFLCGILALIGLPPFGPFISEFIIFRAGFAAHSTSYAVAGIALLAVVFAGMLGSVNSMLYGPSTEPLQPGDPMLWPLAPVALNIILLLGLGLTLPSAVREFLGGVLKVVGVSL